MSEKNILAMFSSGNRCGHDKANPRLFVTPTHHRPRPQILQNAAERAGRFYVEDDRYLPRLRTANDSWRRQRSERRESAAAVMQVMLHYTDLATLEVGTPRASGKINGLRIGFVADKLGFGHARVWRAVNDLKTAGYINVRTKLVKVSGKIFSVARIMVHPQAFYDLGVKPLSLNLSRHYKRQSLAKRGRWRTNRQISAQEAGAVALGVPVAPRRAAFERKNRKPKTERRGKREEGGSHRKRAATAAFYRLLKEGWTTDEIRARLGAGEDATLIEMHDLLQRAPLPEKPR